MLGEYWSDGLLRNTRLREVVGIRLLDHLILGDDRIYSFADQGWPL